MNTLQSSHTEAAEPGMAKAGLSAAPVAAASRLKVVLVLVIALVVLGLAVVAGLVPRWRQRAALRVETRELAVAAVTVASPAPGKAADGLSLPAEIKSFMETSIYARANGYLKRWLVDLGGQVEAGQLLAEIDTPEINQDLAKARAELTQAEAALSLSKITATRWADLVKTASVSEQEAAEKQADLALKSAMLGAASAAVRRLEELQSFGRVVAPFAGTITLRRAEVGDLIAAGSAKELFHLAQTRTLRVFVRVPQNMARSIAAGQSAEVMVPDVPGRVFPGKVVRTSGAMSADSRTLLVELEVDNSKGEILAGSYAQVKLTDAQVESPPTLPSNTLLFRAEGPQVGVVRADGKVELRSVTLGRDFGPTVEILAGVGPAERVILNPSDSLVSGAAVRVVER